MAEPQPVPVLAVTRAHTGQLHVTCCELTVAEALQVASDLTRGALVASYAGQGVIDAERHAQGGGAV